MNVAIRTTLSGIGRMLTYDGTDLHDVDAFMDDDDDTSDTDSVGDYANMYRRNNGSALDPPGIATSYTNDTADMESGGGTPRSNDQLQENGDTTNDGALDVQTDPFAPRVGKTLVWRNINMTLVSLLLASVCAF
jgi:hypothetical protein